MLYKQQNALRRVRSGDKLQNADKCVLKELAKSLDGEDTDWRLCKHCGCMLNTDYI